MEWIIWQVNILSNPGHLNLLLIYEAVGIRIADVSGDERHTVGSSGFTLRLSVFTFSELSIIFSFCADNSSVKLTSLVFLSRLVAKVTDQNPRRGSSHRRKSENVVMSWRRRRKSLLLLKTAAKTPEQIIPSNSRPNKPVRKFCEQKSHVNLFLKFQQEWWCHPFDRRFFVCVYTSLTCQGWCV